MSKYNSYEKNKNSEIAWLGDIPEHWQVKKLKHIASCNDEVLTEKTDSNLLIKYTDISSVSLIEGMNEPEEMLFADAPSRARRIIRKGDTIVSTVRTYLKAICYVNDEIKDAIASTGFAVIRPSKKVDSKFLSYYLQSEGFIGEVMSKSLGVSYPAINPSTLMQIEAILLPLDEQKQIAEFLDKKTQEIDALISKKEEFINLLSEKRIALITHAVTKGINSDVEYKFSNFEWLGDIPENWEVKRLQFISEIRNSNVDKKSYEDQKDVLLCNYVDVYNNDFITKDIDFMEATASEYEIKKFTLNIGDIIITKDSESPNDIGIPAIIKDKITNLVCGYHLTVIKPKIHEQYLFYAIKGEFARNQFSVEANGVTRYGLGLKDIKTTMIAYPKTIEEQKQIAKFLDEKTQEIDGLVKKTQETIDKLKEYRVALITDAVTGKIKVTS